MNQLNIHIRLKDARKYLSLNQQTVAADLHIKQKTVSEIENGKILNIPNKYIYYFYEKGISLDWIYTGEGNMLRDMDPAETNNEAPEKYLPNKEDAKNEEKIDEILSEPAKQESKVLNANEFSALLHAKDETIKHLIKYIDSQEKNISFLQEIIRKELRL